MGLSIQIPPTDDERAAMCRCKPRLTPPPPTPPPSLSPSQLPSPSPTLSPILSLIPSPHPSPIPSLIASPIPSIIPSPISSLTSFSSPPPTLPPFLNVTVMFNNSLFSEGEAKDIIEITVVATGTSSVPYTVTITPSELVPVSARELFDYSNDTIVLTFSPGDTKKSVLIVINPNCTREGSEFFNLTLSLDSAAVALGITLGDPSVAVVKIKNTLSKLFTISKSNKFAFTIGIYEQHLIFNTLHSI